LITLLLLLTIPPSTQEVDSVPAEDIVLPETVVVAPRSEKTVTTSEAKTTVVTGEELIESGARTLPQAIGETTGVWIQETNQGGGAPVVRGLLGNKVLVMIDGVRVNDSTTRQGPNQSLNTIDPAIIDQVVVTHGTSSVLYGSDAIGGVIAVWTKQRLPASRDPEGEARPLRAQIEGEYVSSSDGLRGSGTVSYATDKHGLLATWSGWDWGDLTAGNNTLQPHTGYEGTALFGSWNFALTPEKMLRGTGRINRDFDVPRTDKLVAGYGQTEPTHEVWDYTLQDRRGYQLTYDDGKATGFFDSMQLRLSARSYDEQRSKQKTGDDRSRFETDEVETFGLGADWRKMLGEDHLLTFGLDIDHDAVDSARRDTDLTTGEETFGEGSYAPNSRYTQTGVFVQDEVFGLEPYYVTMGLRYSFYAFAFDEFGNSEKQDGNFDALTASLEVARELPDDWFVVGTLAQGFRAPNLNDLAHDGSFAGGELHNPDLVPEKSLTAELAVEVEKPRWSALAAVFATRIDDYIGRTLLDAGDPDFDGDELYQRTNSGSAKMWGAELGANYALIKGTDEYRVGAAASWVRGREYAEAPLDGVEMRRIPPLSGRVYLRYQPNGLWKHLDWSEFALLWADRQDELHPEDITDPRINPTGTPGWAVLNFDVGGSIDAHSGWRVGLHNILDQHYRVHGSGVDAPGITLVIGLHLGF
jgi:hemoglobin/transferrin/lactoferrin receptor protein